MKGKEEYVQAIMSRQAWQRKLNPTKFVSVTHGLMEAFRGLPQDESCVLNQPGTRIERAKRARNIQAHLQAIPKVEAADSLEES